MDIKDLLIKMIKAIDFFRNLSDDQAFELSQNFVLNIYQPGYSIIREGQKPDKIYLLKNGELEVRKTNGSSLLRLGEILPGEIFGEMSYMKNNKALASVVALAPCDIWEIDVSKFDTFLSKNPDIKNDVMDVMDKREKMNESKLKDVANSSLEQDDLKILL